jgi:hypothetical protein
VRSNWACPFLLKVLPGQADSPCVSSQTDETGHVGFPTDLTDQQWALVKPLLNVSGKRGRKFGNRHVRAEYEARLGPIRLRVL